MEPLRCAYDIQDELNLETNEHIKRVEEIILNADSTEFWYVDEDRSTDTHLVCYFEEVQLMANANHPMVDTDRSLFEYGKINANEYQDTNFICTHVMPNGVSRIYMSIDKDQLLYQVFTNETIKEYIAQNPITIWYAIRYPVSIPRSMSKGHLLTLDGQTDVSISTNGKEVGLPLVKFNIGETEYNVDNKTLSIKNTTEGAQIRNIVLEGNTPINYARGNGVNTTEATSDTRYDFDPFYDGQTTIQGTIEGGYVSAKLYGDTMVNIAKPYGESPLLAATNASTLCDDLLGMNEEGVVLADGEITEGRIYGNSIKRENPTFKLGNLLETTGAIELNKIENMHTDMIEVPPRAFSFYTGRSYTKIAYYDANRSFISCQFLGVAATIKANIPSNAKYVRYGAFTTGNTTEDDFTWKYEDGTDVYNTIQSVVNPTVYNVNENLFDYESFKTSEVINGYVNIPIKLKPSTIYHIISDYGEWNGSTVFLYLARQESNGSFTNLLSLIDQNQANTKGKSFATTSEENYIVRAMSDSRNLIIEKAEKIGIFEGNFNEHEITPHKHSQATFPYTLNKLPNGVADYIDVVNKVHVQRVERIVLDGSENWIKQHNITDYTLFSYILPTLPKNTSIRLDCMICDKINVENYQNLQAQSREFITIRNGETKQLLLNISNSKASDVSAIQTYLASNHITVLYELATPIYTPLTEEEIAQLPLSAYKDGYINLSSDQLMPSFEFRMRASNRYQVDMLETGYYYLNAPVGNVKLGTANVDVQQMPCIVKVDNVGTGDSGYRLGFSGEQIITHNLSLYDEIGYLNNVGQVELGQGRDNVTPYMLVGDTVVIRLSNINNTSSYLYSISYYDENKKHIRTVIDTTINNGIAVISGIGSNVKYIRISMQLKTMITTNPNIIVTINSYPITLAKLPSHRIPTTFTQGMKCGTDFGYWEGVKESKFDRLWTTNYDWSLCDDTKLSSPIQLNRIEYGNTIVEDEFDIATGKFTKRIGKYTIDGNSNLWEYSVAQFETATHMSFCCSSIPNFKKGGRCIGFLGIKIGAPNSTNSEENWSNLGVSDSLYFRFKKDRYSYYGNGINGVRAYFNANPTTIYFELEVPEISYLMPTKNIVKTSTNSQSMQTTVNNGYLNPQIKPSHLTYPVPSLVGNRAYTVVHNRKNITGSTKPIELNLGGTVVQLNDASSKTLVKTPSTLAHSNLIFIGGESTVDHVMVLDGDWTNKPIEYFENMKGHDTDAIITIMGDGKIDDVAEQYLW